MIEAVTRNVESLVEAGNRVAYGLRDLAIGVALALTPGPEELLVGAVAGAARASIPAVENAKLGNLVSDLFKGARGPDPIGTGSTADAIRYERLTGNPVGGTFHTVKGEQYRNALDTWLRKNPGASDYDRLVARSLRDDLDAALRIGRDR